MWGAFLELLATKSTKAYKTIEIMVIVVDHLQVLAAKT